MILILLLALIFIVMPTMTDVGIGAAHDNVGSGTIARATMVMQKTLPV